MSVRHRDRMRGMSRRTNAVIAAALLVAVAVLVVGVWAVGVALRGEDGAPPVKDEHFLSVDTPGVLGFENGDCFLDPDANAALGEDILVSMPCVGAHNQVFAFVPLLDGLWHPESVAEQSWAACRERFESFWDSAGRSALDLFPVMPTERSWLEDGDRHTMCVVHSPDGVFTVDPLESRKR